MTPSCCPPYICMFRLQPPTVASGCVSDGTVNACCSHYCSLSTKCGLLACVCVCTCVFVPGWVLIACQPLWIVV